MENLLSHSHRLLLKAALSKGEQALDAWRRWSLEFDLDSIDSEGFWLLPLLYKNLAAQNFQGPEKQRLSGVYKQLRLHNTIACPVLSGLIRSLEEAGISTIPGPVTLWAINDQKAAVSASPAELFVSVAMLEKADEILQSQNWLPKTPLPTGQLRAFVRNARYGHHKGGDLKLGWRPFGLDCHLDQDAGLWQRAVTSPGENSTPHQASPVDSALIACREHSLLQIAVLMSRLASEINWQEARSRSRDLGLEHEWLALTGGAPPALQHGVPTPIVRGEMDPKARPKQDETISLWHLSSRHWRRYRACPKNERPASFSVYLISYYQYCWQISSKLLLFPTAIKKVFGRWQT